MTELEFQDIWESEKHKYAAWGQFVVSEIQNEIFKKGKDIDVFLKVPAKSRVKDNDSLLNKAFFRIGKNYSDPYNEIEDKVGVRFVVLLIEDIELISSIITESSHWSFDACKHFNEDKEREPLLFAYQSVHFTLKSNQPVLYNHIDIPANIPCEVQIRTILQHAHAELTHDAIYKSKRVVKPKVHRTVAKSMALIETTDDFFTLVTKQLKGPVEDLGIISCLDALYYSYTDIKSSSDKLLIVILDEFEELVDENLISSIEKYINANKVIAEIIKAKYTEGNIYKQSTVLLLYWMLKRRRQKLLDRWPFDRNILVPFANDIGIALT
jgi:ppGpp synthetase/RelA/SpoT-type nucleotidyltranferase